MWFNNVDVLELYFFVISTFSIVMLVSLYFFLSIIAIFSILVVADKNNWDIYILVFLLYFETDI